MSKIIDQFSLIDPQKQKLTELVSVFLDENTKINLSAIRDEKGVWEKHIYDSLLFLQLETYKNTSLQNQKCLDIGTGGGFPLFPLSIVFPSWKFYGLDSVGKKLKSIERMAENLEIKNITLHHGRAEEMAHDKNFREQFDLVTARAVAKYPTLLEIAVGFIKVGGFLVLYRGPEKEETDEKLAEKWGLELREKKYFELPEGEERNIWILEKIKKFPKEFPRAVGVPKKEPIFMREKA